jgi:hypothetical protein
MPCARWPVQRVDRLHVQSFTGCVHGFSSAVQRVKFCGFVGCHGTLASSSLAFSVICHTWIPLASIIGHWTTSLLPVSASLKPCSPAFWCSCLPSHQGTFLIVNAERVGRKQYTDSGCLTWGIVTLGFHNDINARM